MRDDAVEEVTPTPVDIAPSRPAARGASSRPPTHGGATPHDPPESPDDSFLPPPPSATDNSPTKPPGPAAKQKLPKTDSGRVDDPSSRTYAHGPSPVDYEALLEPSSCCSI